MRSPVLTAVARAAALPVLLAVLLLALAAGDARAQQRDTAVARLAVSVRAGGGPVEGATVVLGDMALLTPDSGVVTFRVATGPHRVSVAKPGFRTWVATVAVRGDTTVVVDLAPSSAEPADTAGGDEHGEGEEDEHEVEGLVVTATRGERRIEELPVRVEVLGREEVEEKMLMTPGDVAMMLNETSGLRVQSTSPSLGGANVRVQGLRGRYTQVLSDGLPLYGGQSGALGLLQIPPMDLAQVEVIKGAASALYGGAALGGVVNLVSRRPGGDRDLLLNGTTRGGADAVGWSSGALSGRWGYTLLAGAHLQRTADVDDDGWADLPAYRRAVVRPRFFWDGGEGRSLFVTAGTTLEEREGGGDVPGGGEFAEELRTGRFDAGLVGRFVVMGDRLLAVRASAVAQGHRHLFGPVRERDRHATTFAESSLGGTDGGHSWLLGAALQRETYRAEDVEGFDYAFTTPSLFAQDEYAPVPWLTLLASGRVDRHSEYGTFFSPRLSALLRPGEGWSVRASAGTGYYAPTPFTEETEAIGLSRLVPLSTEGHARLKAERARTASLDVGRTVGGFELNATVFGSRIENPVYLVFPVDDLPAGTLATGALANAAGETRTWGTELLARWHSGPWHATATHTWLRSREADPDQPGERREVPLTPRHQAGIVGMWEAEGRGRVGVEVYYTGTQRLEDNPYRDESEAYVVLGLLLERRVGRARVFLNAENLLDVRQTRDDPLVLPARSVEGRWSTDLWAPAEGRVVNAGVRIDL